MLWLEVKRPPMTAAISHHWLTWSDLIASVPFSEDEAKIVIPPLAHPRDTRLQPSVSSLSASFPSGDERRPCNWLAS